MLNNGPYLLGIDYGTESCRVAIFDLAGRPLTFAATPYKTTHPRPGWAEQDPEEWWKALQASCHRAIAAAGISPAAIAGISYDATTLTMVAMDERGNELRPAMMWMDVRATSRLHALRTRIRSPASTTVLAFLRLPPSDTPSRPRGYETTSRKLIAEPPTSSMPLTG